MQPDMGAIAEYREKAADYAARAAELDAVTAERDEVRQGIIMLGDWNHHA